MNITKLITPTMNCTKCNTPLEYLNKAQAARLIGVDRKTIYNWIDSGRIKLHGNKVKRSEILAIKN